MSASTFKCPQCNAPIFYPGGEDVTIECMFCGHNVIVPPELRTGPGSSTSAPAPEFVGFDALPTEGPEPDVVYHIKQLLGVGNKIEAIKLYRQVTGLGLKEAKDAVEAIQAGQSIRFTNLPSAKAPQSQATLLAVKTLLQAGKKIEAIKVYRQLTGVGLKEAKDVVEAMEAGVADANTFQVDAPFESLPGVVYSSRPARSPTASPPAAGLSCIVVSVIAGAVFLAMMVVAVALLVYNLAG